MTTQTRTSAHLSMGDSFTTLVEMGDYAPHWKVEDHLAYLSTKGHDATRPHLNYYSKNADDSFSAAYGRAEIIRLLQEDPASLRVSYHSVRWLVEWLNVQATAKAAAEELMGGRFITLREAESIVGMTPTEYARQHYFLVHKWEEFLPEYYRRTPKGSVRKMRGGEINDALEDYPGEILILESDAHRFAFEKPGVDRRLEKEWEESSDNC